MRETAPVDTTIPSDSACRGTTMFAVAWGVLACFQLLRGVLITHSLRFMVVGPMALLMVWGTLERKRWGRLALLGMSLTVLTVCLAGARVADATGAAGLHATLDFFAAGPGGIGAVLLLAAWTLYWMRRSDIVAEFEAGKRVGLLAGQRAIAATLVGAWAAVLIVPSLFPPGAGERTRSGRPGRSPGQARPAGPASTSLMARSAASRSRP